MKIDYLYCMTLVIHVSDNIIRKYTNLHAFDKYIYIYIYILYIYYGIVDNEV